MTLRSLSRAGFAWVLICTWLSPALAHARVGAASRDHLTPKEAELVRDTQVLDKRIEIFIRAAERRLLALTDPGAATSTQVQKEMEKWGELPKGTRAELLMDLSKIIDEAITNIDDVAARDEKNQLLPKALRRLADASARFLAQLTTMRERAQDGRERDALEQAVENLQSVIEAANRLPPDVKKEKAKGRS